MGVISCVVFGLMVSGFIWLSISIIEAVMFKKPQELHEIALKRANGEM